ncbi:MAG: hypothetical protein IJG09_05065, partial [Methanobrevibacter sp.]|nr:hypothetical protein [Methanobrevibacter sp.]
PIPSNVQVYTKASEVGENPLLRHKIVDGKVVETSVGLFHSVLNDYIYLVGGGATYNASNNTYIGDSPFYLRNKAELVSMYGNTCSESRKNGVLVYECDWIDVGADGDIWAQLDCHNGCAITPDGSSYCGAIRC